MRKIHCIDLSANIKTDARGLSFFPWQGRLKVPGDLAATFHLISISPGQSRGHHLHPGHSEYLYPFHGRAIFIWEAAPGQVQERVISGGRTLVHIPPGLAHAVTNPGPELLYLLAWREVEGPTTGEPETVAHHLGGATP
jgi:oxalate decarboxylase/phosphoglucose isomerase-like protein (cupin superfamily)